MGLVMTLLVLGVVLLLLETVLPGMIAGVIGFGCLVAAVVASYTEFGAKAGNFALLAVSLGLVVGTLLWMKYFPASPVARLFISRKVIGDVGAEQPDLLHQVGKSITPLRPSGMVDIGGRRIDVVSEGGMVERDTPVKVVAIEGMRVVVRPISPEEWVKRRKDSGSAAVS